MDKRVECSACEGSGRRDSEFRDGNGHPCNECMGTGSITITIKKKGA
jgi:DnaJ-class molecular chaperone